MSHMSHMPNKVDNAPSAHETLQRHEALMVELLRVTGTQEERTPAVLPSRNDPNEIQYLIAKLLVHWKVVRATTGQVDLSPLREDP